MTNSNVNIRRLNLGEQMYDVWYMTLFLSSWWAICDTFLLVCDQSKSSCIRVFFFSISITGWRLSEWYDAPRSLAVAAVAPSIKRNHACMETWNHGSIWKEYTRFLWKFHARILLMPCMLACSHILWKYQVFWWTHSHRTVNPDKKRCCMQLQAGATPLWRNMQATSHEQTPENPAGNLQAAGADR